MENNELLFSAFDNDVMTVIANGNCVKILTLGELVV